MIDAQRLSIYRRWAVVCGITAIVGSLVVIAGWLLNISMLKSVVPGLVEMKFNTAVVFILTGVSLWGLISLPGSLRALGRLAPWAGVLGLLVSAATIMEEATGRDLGIDQLLYAERAGTTISPHLGRMALMTAICFVLLNTALLLLHWSTKPRWQAVAQGLTLLAGLSTYQCLLAYLFGVRLLIVDGTNLSAMALQTIVLFFILAAGILLARVESGIMVPLFTNSIAGSMASRVVALAIVLPAVLGWVELQGERRHVFSDELGVSLMAIINVAIITSFLLLSARSLHKSEQRHAASEEARRQEKERYQQTLMSIGDAVITTDAQGNVDLINRVAEALTGWTQAEARGRPIGEVFHIVHEHTREEVESPVARVLREGAVVGLANHTALVSRNGHHYSIADSGAPVRGADGQMKGVVLVFRDITRDSRIQYERETLLRLTTILNASNSTRELIASVTGFMQIWTGCAAAGIRLQEGEDYPYYEARGFPKKFVEMENYLCQRDGAGNIIRDDVGNPALECMCGNVLRGRFDKALPFFSPRGSFWTNSTTELLASTAGKECTTHTRNRCVGEGYESVALIRLQYGGETLGLLQLNDHARGRFNPESIAFLESAAGQIALAIAHHQSRAALAESARLYRSLFDNMINGFAYCRMIFEGNQAADFVYLSVNAAFETLTGLKDVAGKRVTEVIANIRRDDPELLETYGRVVRTGKPETFETYVHALKMWFSISVYRPEPDHFVAVFDVVTARKQAEEELRTSEQRYRALVENVGLGVVLIDADYRIRMVNAAQARLFGKKPADFIGKECYREFEKRDWVCPQCPGKVAMATGQSAEMERTGVRDDGGAPTAIVRAFPLPLAEGKPCGFIEVTEDITESRRFQAELQEANLFNLQVIRSAKEGVIVYDKELRIQLWNPFMEKLTDKSAEEVNGKKSVEVFPFLKDTGLPERLEAALAGKEPAALEFAYEIPWNGKKGWASDVSAPLRNAAGEVIGVIGTVRDITETRRLEAQFREAQKMEAVGQLAGGVAHDFRNQLTVIRGFADLLAQNPELGSEARGKIEGILQAVEKSSKLIGGLMAFSRKQTLQVRHVDINQAVGELMQVLPKLLGEDIRLSLRAAPQAAWASIDPAQLHQALMNLAHNARDAMPKGGALEIEIAAVGPNDANIKNNTEVAPGEFIAIRVRDSGTGMDPATMGRIFEPFFTTKPVGKGTGLGLAMVYGFAKQSGGLVTVQSVPGSGSVFTLYLPATSGAEPAMSEPGAVSPTAAGEGRAAKAATILLVEDEEPLRHVGGLWLRKQGYHVLEADGRAAALALLRRENVALDLLVTDLVMPGGSGLDLAKEVKQLYPNAGVLYVSGYAERDLTERGLKTMPGTFLLKPFDLTQLSDAVHAILKGATAR